MEELKNSLTKQLYFYRQVLLSVKMIFFKTNYTNYQIYFVFITQREHRGTTFTGDPTDGRENLINDDDYGLELHSLVLMIETLLGDSSWHMSLLFHS